MLGAILILLVFVILKASAQTWENHRKFRNGYPPVPEMPTRARHGSLATESQRARFLANQMTYDQLVEAWKNCDSPSMKKYYQRQIDYLNDQKEEP